MARVEFTDRIPDRQNRVEWREPYTNADRITFKSGHFWSIAGRKYVNLTSKMDYY